MFTEPSFSAENLQLVYEFRAKSKVTNWPSTANTTVSDAQGRLHATIKRTDGGVVQFEDDEATSLVRNEYMDGLGQLSGDRARLHPVFAAGDTVANGGTHSGCTRR